MNKDAIAIIISLILTLILVWYAISSIGPAESMKPTNMPSGENLNEQTLECMRNADLGYYSDWVDECKLRGQYGNCKLPNIVAKAVDDKRKDDSSECLEVFQK